MVVSGGGVPGAAGGGIPDDAGSPPRCASYPGWYLTRHGSWEKSPFSPVLVWVSWTIIPFPINKIWEWSRDQPGAVLIWHTGTGEKVRLLSAEGVRMVKRLRQWLQGAACISLR